ncbi:MAG: Ig-like domain-containing protein [Porphyromonadaceae bacterium]|nr:Ig-like domain-containing protein [Porphyromonadaceae bacterium]
MKKTFCVSMLTFAVVILGLFSCEKPSQSNIPVTSVSLDIKEKAVNVGEEFTLTVTVTPDNASDKSVKWTSSDSEVASVDQIGKVKALKDGTTTITAITNDGAKQASCVVKVTETFATSETKVDVLSFQYLGNLSFGEGYHMYRLDLVPSGTVKIEPNGKYKFIKKGAIYSFYFSSNAPASDDNLNPTFGDYTISQDFSKMTFDMEQSFLWEYDDYGVFADERPKFKSGNLNIGENKITFKGIDENDGKHNLVFTGNYSVIDIRPNEWADEPKEPTTINKAYSLGELVIGGVISGTDTRRIWLSTKPDPDDQLIASIVFVISADASILTTGTYTVSDSREKNTILKSIGSQETSTGKKYTNSFVGTSDGDYHCQPPIYFIDSGNAIVTETNIIFEGLSHFGSRLKITYIGNMEPIQR